MAIIKWINATIATFQTPSAWTGGIAPGNNAIAVISSAGDAAPTAASYGLLLPAAGSSEAYLSSLDLAQDTQHQVSEANGRTLVYYTTPQYASVPAGEIIATKVIDLIGAGSETMLSLQNSTLAKTTQTNVSGDAYVYASYTNVLAGTVNIGYTMKVGGQTQPTPPADQFGFHSALYLSDHVYGSWNDSGQLSGYVPGTDNTGTINVAGGSGLVVFVGGTAGSTVSSGTMDDYTAPNVAQFENAGTIKLSAGAAFELLDYSKGMFVNNGTVNLDGANGQTTTGLFNAMVSGTGTFNISGNTQTDPTKTAAYFTNLSTGQNLDINDAGVLLDPGNNASFSGLTYTGGTVAFSGKAGILQIDAPQALSIGQMFNESISGFAAGDYISLDYYLQNYATGWQPGLVWNQAQHTLQLYDVTSSPSGQQSALQASFILSGTYQSSSFHVVDASWNGQSLDPVQLSIETTTTAPGASAAARSPSAIAHPGPINLNLAAAALAHAHPAMFAILDNADPDVFSPANAGFGSNAATISATRAPQSLEHGAFGFSETPGQHAALIILSHHAL